MYFKKRNYHRDGEWRKEVNISDLMEIERILHQTGRMYQEKPLSFNSKKQVKKCMLYFYPHSEKQLQEDKLLFTPYARINLVYDFREGSSKGWIEVSEKSLAFLESDIYFCHNQHESNYKIVYPVKPGYVIHCNKCGQPMKLTQKALLPGLRQMIAGLQKGEQKRVSRGRI